MAFLQVDVCLAGHKNLGGVGWHSDRLADGEAGGAVVVLRLMSAAAAPSTLAQYTELIFSTLPLLATLLSAAAIEVVTA